MPRGISAAAPTTVDIGGAIRDTDEYVAAYDLEVWKAQQQLRYQAQLKQDKEALERRLRQQMREREQQRLAELEKLRQELEHMGQRLQVAEETLDKRAAQLEAREAAFHTKRVKVAELHESYVAHAEEQARYTREEAQLTQTSLQARLLEKDRILQQLQEKLSASQQEYELLRRRAARHLSEQTDTDGQRLREQECALTLAQSQLQEVQRMLRDKNQEAARLAEEKLRLQQQVHDVTKQLRSMTRQYHRLNEETQAREWERLRREQDALDAARHTRLLEPHSATVSTAVLPLRQQSSNHLPPTESQRRTRGAHSSVAASTAPPSPLTGAATATESRETFYDMLTSLKQEVAAGLAAAAASAAASRAPPSQPSALPFKIVEKPFDSSRTTRSATATHTLQGVPKAKSAQSSGRNTARANLLTTTGAHHRPPSSSSTAASAIVYTANSKQDAAMPPDENAATPSKEDEGEQGSEANETASSVSVAVSRIPPARSTPSLSTATSSPEPRFTPSVAAATSSRPRDRDVVVDMGDTSLETSFPRVDVQSWPASFMPMDREAEVGGDVRDTSSVSYPDGSAAVAPLPPVRAGTLPPLAPDLRGLPERDDDEKYAGQSAKRVPTPHVSPTPEEFVLSRDARWSDDPTSSEYKTRAARRDMESFVNQLKMNREKLLETGVYTEQDRVVREMGEKIHMYEQYLDRHR